MWFYDLWVINIINNEIPFTPLFISLLFFLFINKYTFFNKVISLFNEKNTMKENFLKCNQLRFLGLNFKFLFLLRKIQTIEPALHKKPNALRRFRTFLKLSNALLYRTSRGFGRGFVTNSRSGMVKASMEWDSMSRCLFMFFPVFYSFQIVLHWSCLDIIT